MMKYKRIFISGGAGVIGRELVYLLNKEGFKILIGDLKPKPIDFTNDIIYRKGDLNLITKNEIEEFQPDIFFHLAATFERTSETYDFWNESYHSNIKLTHHLMNLVKNIPTIKRVVFASSYLVYNPTLYLFSAPQNKPVFLNESNEIKPRNLIGMAKLFNEMDIKFFDGFNEASFSSVCVRIFRGYGLNGRDVISRWIRKLLNSSPIEIYKEDGIFDYIYAKDSAEGLFRLADSEFQGIINLGSGKGRKVKDVLNILHEYFPQMIKTDVHSDIAYEASQSDNTMLKSIINWEPEYDLERAIPEMIEHERSCQKIQAK